MCGISGVFSLESDININKVIEMNNIVSHRGPDDEGYYIYDNSGLDGVYTGEYSSREAIELMGKSIKKSQFKNPKLVLSHRRLSIIDLSVDGFQPILNTMKFFSFLMHKK